MDDDSKNKDYVDFFTKMVDTQGVAASTVKDGHVLMFKREWLQRLLESTPISQDEILVFIKRPDFKD